jgi:hypothetical protein
MKKKNPIAAAKAFTVLFYLHWCVLRFHSVAGQQAQMQTRECIVKGNVLAAAN